MNAADPAIVLIAAAHLDIFFGDPVYSLHPVRLIGRLVGVFEKLLRKLGATGLLGGGMLAISVTAVSVIVFLGLRTEAIPTQVIKMLPYLITLIVLVAFVGRATAPKASGRPFGEDL